MNILRRILLVLVDFTEPTKGVRDLMKSEILGKIQSSDHPWSKTPPSPGVRGDGKRSKQLIQTVVTSNKTGRGGVEDTKKENPTDFPTPPPPKLI